MPARKRVTAEPGFDLDPYWASLFDHFWDLRTGGTCLDLIGGVNATLARPDVFSIRAGADGQPGLRGSNTAVNGAAGAVCTRDTPKLRSTAAGVTVAAVVVFENLTSTNEVAVFRSTAAPLTNGLALDFFPSTRTIRPLLVLQADSNGWSANNDVVDARIAVGVPWFLALQYDRPAQNLRVWSGPVGSPPRLVGSFFRINGHEPQNGQGFPVIGGMTFTGTYGAFPGVIHWVAATGRRTTSADMQALGATPWAPFMPLRRHINPAVAVSIYRPGTDVSGTWTPVGGASVAATLADEAQGNYAESPDLSSPQVCTWNPPLPAGTWTLPVGAQRTDTTGQVRIVCLDAGGASVGATAWQALTLTPTLYSLSVTTTATSTQFRIEVQP